jgi:hypothetical protein
MRRKLPMDKPIFEQLIPVVVRPESLQTEKEIAPAPNFRCFCCEDTGWIRSWLVKLVIRDYNPNRDRNPTCKNCGAGGQWMHLEGNIDTRFHAITCQKLHNYAKEEDEKARRQQWENSQKAKQLTLDFAKNKSLRKGDRTANDTREALLRKQNEQAGLDKRFEQGKVVNE